MRARRLQSGHAFGPSRIPDLRKRMEKDAKSIGLSLFRESVVDLVRKDMEDLLVAEALRWR